MNAMAVIEKPSATSCQVNLWRVGDFVVASVTTNNRKVGSDSPHRTSLAVIGNCTRLPDTPFTSTWKIDPRFLAYTSPIRWDNVILYGEYAMDRNLVSQRHYYREHIVEN